jgi:hypothetical protein
MIRRQSISKTNNHLPTSLTKQPRHVILETHVLTLENTQMWRDYTGY